MVLVSHLIAIFLPAFYFGSTDLAFQVADAFSESPLFSFINGGFAVAIFFVLSGFVISTVASRATEPLALLIGRRYLRLTIPIICSVLFSYTLIQIMPTATSALYSVSGNGFLLDVFYQRENYPLYLALWDGIYNCYKFGESYINNVLWSMQIELFGSILIYLAYRSINERDITYFWLASIPIILLLGTSKGLYFLGFSFGTILYRMQLSQNSTNSRSLTLLLISTGLLLGSAPVQSPIDTILMPLTNALGGEAKGFPILTSVGAALLLVGIINSEALKDYLRRPITLWLGKISFMLYLTHLPLLAILGSSLFLKFQPTGVGVGLFFCSLLALSLIIAWLLTILVEIPTVRILGRLKSKTIHPAAIATGIVLSFASISAYASRVGFSWLLVAVLLCMNAAFILLLNSIILKYSAIQYSTVKKIK